MSEHQSEQHFNDLSIDELFKQFQQATQAGDTITEASINAIVLGWRSDPNGDEKYAAWEQRVSDWKVESEEDQPMLADVLATKPTLTRNDLLAMVGYYSYLPLEDGRTTLCIMDLKNGSTTIGKSQVMYAENNDPKKGAQAAFDDAVEQLWPLAGFKHLQEQYELRLVQEVILPALEPGVSAEQAERAQIIHSECSPAVQLLIRELSRARLQVAYSAKDSEELTRAVRDDVIPAIMGDNVKLVDAIKCQRVLSTAPEGVRLLAGELRRVVDNIDLNGLEEPSATNFELTTRVNQAAGNVPDGTDAQLRKQGRIILDEVKELLGELEMDALFHYDHAMISKLLIETIEQTAEDNDTQVENLDAGIVKVYMEAKGFLSALEYQTLLFNGGIDEELASPVNRYKVRGELQDVLVTTYGLAYYLQVDADDDHREVSRANLSKFDPTMDLAIITQMKYRDLGVSTDIRRTEVHWPHFQGAYYANIVSEDVTGTDGKFYPKGKFVKSIRFEEPRYKPALIHKPVRFYEEGLTESVTEAGREALAAHVLDNSVKDLYPHKVDLLNLSLHAPTHPGYFEDMAARKAAADVFKKVSGAYPTQAEIYLITQGGYDWLEGARVFGGFSTFPDNSMNGVFTSEFLEQVFGKDVPETVTYRQVVEQIEANFVKQEQWFHQALSRSLSSISDDEQPDLTDPDPKQ